MKIALLTNGIYPFVIGGMQKHSYYLSKFFAFNKVKVIVFHFIPEPSKAVDLSKLYTPEELEYIEFKAFPIPKTDKLPGHYLRFNKALSKAYYELVKEIQPDFIYTKGLVAWHLLEEKEKGEDFPPISVQMHGLEMFQLHFTFMERLKALMLRPAFTYNVLEADYIFSYGGKIKDLHLELGAPAEKIFINHGAVDAKEVIEIPFPTPEVKRFVFTARFEKRKGLALLTKVLKDLQKDLDFEFNFIGDVPETLKLKGEQFKYWGLIRDRDTYFDILAKCDILVVPSIAEGFPTVIVESMSRGLSIIATDVGAIRAAVKDSNGWLIPPQNEKALKSTLQQVIKLDPKAIDQRKQGSLEIVKKDFIWDKNVKEVISTIETIIK